MVNFAIEENMLHSTLRNNSHVCNVVEGCEDELSFCREVCVEDAENNNGVVLPVIQSN